MTKEERAKCHKIIHGSASVTAAIGAGLAQLPCADAVAITPIQLAMIVSLGGVFGIRLQQSTAESTLAASVATTMGRGASQVLVAWLPVFGNICNALTAGVVTEILGWSVATDFANRANPKNNRKGNDHIDNNKKRK